MRHNDDFTDNKTVRMFTNFLNQNSPTLAMIGGILCMAGALISAYKASRSVTEIKDNYDQEVQKTTSEGQEMTQTAPRIKELKVSRNLRLVLAYRWVLLFGAGAMSLMFLCNYLNGAKIAGLTALVAWKRDELEKLAENGKKILGEEKFKEIEDKTLEDLMLKNFIVKDAPFALEPAKHQGDIFLDTNKGILFQMTEEDLQTALLKAEQECERNHGLAESRFYENYLGVEAPRSAVLFWGPKRALKARIGERQVFGCTFRSIEYDICPSGGEAAGIPGFNK